MYNDLISFLKIVIPTKGEGILMFFGGLWGYVSYALGGVDASITWLFWFAVVDYLSGFIAALKNGEWCSTKSYRGLFKKFFIFVIVALCVGVDEVTQLDVMRTCAIYAFTVNEFGSILENIDKLGYGDVIPEPIRKALKNIKGKQENV